MSKRAPGSALNQDNWDREEAPTEQGTWNRAQESTLKQRVLVRAKRRGTTNTTESSSSSVFGGLSAKIGQPPTAPGSFSFKLNKEEPKVEEKKEEKVEKMGAVTSDDEIRKLNSGLLSWVKKCLENDPICDLRPVMEDYKKYMDGMDKLYGTTWIDAEVVPTDKTAPKVKSPAPTPPPLQVEQTKVTKPASPEKPSFSFGAKEETKKAPTFSFGGGEEKKNDQSKPIFSFSGSSKTDKDEKTEQKPTGGFFSALSAPKTDAPATSGFSFGSGGGGFGSGGGGFSFSASTTKPAPATSTSGGPTGDEEYVPPEAEKAEFDDEKDALFHQKAKIFYMKDGNYKEIGVGQLFVKPLEGDKASILVRADNTLGNILLNVTIPSQPAASALGKKDCMLSIVPNPPIEGVTGAVPLLIRVKTPDDRDTLLELVKSKQN